jgi:hypothetical protein
MRQRFSLRSYRFLTENLISFALCSLLFLTWNSFAGEAWHVGPAYDEFPLTLTPGEREEAFGPFFYNEQSGSRHTWAIPPLLSYSEDPDTHSSEFDLAYPVLTYDRYGEQYRWQIGQLLSFAGGPTQVETGRNRFTIFPFYFQQRSTEPSETYTAVFPIYGHLKHRLFRDEIHFVLAPIYWESRKKDVVTDNYVYPFFHLRHGEGLEGWQIWPFYGHEHKELTTRTNRFGDPETIPGHEEMFVLWPFFFNQYHGIGTDNLEWRQTSFPAYSVQRSPNRDSTSVMFLFGHVTDREKKYTEWDLPWPFVVFARGEGKTANRVWPFFSHAHTATLQRDFYLWPVYHHSHFHSAPLDRDRARVLLFLYSDINEKNMDTGATRRRLDLWPLFVHHREFNGNSRLQVLALLESFVPASHKIARDYSPVWSVWRSERNGRTGASSESLFWNLYRHESTPESKRTSFFFGLYQSNSSPENKSVRLFYIPLVHQESFLPAINQTTNDAR